MPPGSSFTGVNRSRYFYPYSSVFFRYTSVLPIYSSAAADLLQTITAAFSGTIAPEFSDIVPSALLNVGDLLSDSAT